MADGRPERAGRLTIVIAQLLLVAAAVALWVASRLPWVVITVVRRAGAAQGGDAVRRGMVHGAAAVGAADAGRGRRGARGARLAAAGARGAARVAGLAVGYLGVSLWVLPDVAVRGADLAQVPVTTLVGSERQHWGAGLAVGAAVLQRASPPSC